MSGLGNVGKAVVGIGAPTMAAWMTRESFKGYREEWEHHHQAWREQQQMEQLRYNWGQANGQHKMTGWANGLKKLFLYGPLGIGTTWNRAKTYAEGFVNDVLLKNFMPIAIGTAAFGTVFRKEIGTAARGINQRVLKPIINEIRPHINGKWTRRALGKVADGIASSVKWVFRNPAAMAGAVPILGILGFGALRFNKVYNGEEQDEFLGEYLSKGH